MRDRYDGAGTQQAADRHGTNSLACRSHPTLASVLRSDLHASYDRYAAASARISLSLNGADYDEDEFLPFEFYHPPGVVALEPTAGPLLGGTAITLAGNNLTAGSDRRCRFTPAYDPETFVTEEMASWARSAASEVVASVAAEGAHAATLYCTTPRLHRLSTLEVSLNGQQFSLDGVLYHAHGDHHHDHHHHHDLHHNENHVEDEVS